MSICKSWLLQKCSCKARAGPLGSCFKSCMGQHPQTQFPTSRFLLNLEVSRNIHKKDPLHHSLLNTRENTAVHRSISCKPALPRQRACCQLSMKNGIHATPHIDCHRVYRPHTTKHKQLPLMSYVSQAETTVCTSKHGAGLRAMRTGSDRCLS